MDKQAKDYLRYTFSIMVVCWGMCWFCSFRGMSLSDHYLLYIPYLLGGWSPTIASFLALKKNNRITTLKDWLKNVFDFRHHVVAYVMVAGLGVLFILPQCLISGYEKGAPFVTIFIMVPVMLFGGGLEEAGWRYILQPELEKRYSFALSTLMVGVIWWLWHLPLFCIQGVSQYGENYFAFGVNILGLSFALAAIRRTTGSVWLCVLFHCVANALSGIYMIRENIWGNLAAAVILIVCSYVLVKMGAKE